MWEISFLRFKKYCRHAAFYTSLDSIRKCEHPDHAIDTIIKKWNYSYKRCCASQCPVLQSCKEVEVDQDKHGVYLTFEK